MRHSSKSYRAAYGLNNPANPANMEIKSLFSLVWQWGILHRLKQC
jgi:hypothetical protein